MSDFWEFFGKTFTVSMSMFAVVIGLFFTGIMLNTDMVSSNTSVCFVLEASE